MRWRQLARGAQQQLDAKLRFQLLQRPAQCGLANVQRLAGARHIHQRRSGDDF